jgi:hypothetical protein
LYEKSTVAPEVRWVSGQSFRGRLKPVKLGLELLPLECVQEWSGEQE